GVYGRPPSELRRGRASLAPSSRDEYVLRLAYRPPYDWDSMLAFLEAHAIAGIEEVASGAYRRTFAHGGKSGLLQVTHDERRRALLARVRFSEPLALLPIVARLRALFDLAADPGVVARHFRHDPVLGHLVERRPGLRLPGSWDSFETWVRAALGEGLSG